MVSALIIVIGLCAIAVNYYYARGEQRAIARVTHRWWWEYHKKDRDDLLDAANRVALRGEFRGPRPDESTWTYAKTFDRWRSEQLKMTPFVAWGTPRTVTSVPRLPRFPRLPRLPNLSRALVPTAMTTWESVQYYWWVAYRDGLIHRAVVLKHGDRESFTLRCDHDVLLEPSTVDQHLVGKGPVLTCLRCFGMPA